MFQMTFSWFGIFARKDQQVEYIEHEGVFAGGVVLQQIESRASDAIECDYLAIDHCLVGERFGRAAQRREALREILPCCENPPICQLSARRKTMRCEAGERHNSARSCAASICSVTDQRSVEPDRYRRQKNKGQA
jgi:hypothetical protein